MTSIASMDSYQNEMVNGNTLLNALLPYQQLQLVYITCTHQSSITKNLNQTSKDTNSLLFPSHIF